VAKQASTYEEETRTLRSWGGTDPRREGAASGQVGAVSSSLPEPWRGGCRHQRSRRRERSATAVTRHALHYDARGRAVRKVRAATSMRHRDALR